MVPAPAFALAAAVIVVVPGLALWPWPDRGRVGLAPLAVGGGLALWPLLLLWARLAGATWSGQAVWAVVATGGLMTVAARAGSHGRFSPAGGSTTVRTVAGPLALAAILLTSLALRWREMAGLVAAPWVDGYHHTVITQLFLDQAGLPWSYEPYVRGTFDYHFGFHAVAAAAAQATGAGARQAVLWLGQVVIALAPLAVLGTARLIGLGRAAALGAAALPAAWLWMPAYSLSWGRYTQLAGLLVLPAAWEALRQALGGERIGRWAAARAAILAAGLVLVHYRVSVLYALGALILVAGGAGRMRRLARAGLVAALAVILGLPWWLAALGPAFARLMGPSAGAGLAAAPSAAAGIPDWIFTQHASAFWLRLAILGLLAGLAMRRPAAVAMGAWCALALAAVDGRWLGLGASWTLPPFALAIGLWLPLALGCGLLLEEARGLGLASAPARLAGALILAAYIAVAWLLRSARPSLGETEWLAALASAAIGLALLARRREPFPGRGAPALADDDPGLGPGAAIAVAAFTLVGAWRMPPVLNGSTVILHPSELRAADFLRRHATAGDRVFINQKHWNAGAYRGVDGGYWLPVLTGNPVSIPAAVYALSDAGEIRAAQARSRVLAAGDGLDEDALSGLLDDAGAEWVYVGPGTAREGAGVLHRERLDRSPLLRRRYEDGDIVLYERVGAESHGPLSEGAIIVR